MRLSDRRRRVIVAMGGNSWDPYWQTRQHVLARLAARGWPVVYSTGPFFVWERFGERWNGAGWRDRSEIRDGVHVLWPGRWQMRWPRFTGWDGFIVNAHGRALRRLAAAIDPRAAPILYFFRPAFLPYVAAIGGGATVYHADDTFSLMRGWTDDAEREQKTLVRRADLVIATSRGVARALGAEASVRVLPNGADVGAFAGAGSQACPSDLARIPRPRIGYVGVLSDKVDFALVHAVASAKPSWHWVFIGPEVGSHNLSASNAAHRALLDALPNVHFLGQKPHTGLPVYMQHMDVNAICFRTTPDGWWVDIYPLKLHEYLAVGQPVVSSGLDSICEFSSVVAIADTAEDWVRAIEHAIHQGGRGDVARRRRVAAQNSWEVRVDLLESWLYELPERPGEPPSG